MGMIFSCAQKQMENIEVKPIKKENKTILKKIDKAKQVLVVEETNEKKIIGSKNFKVVYERRRHKSIFYKFRR